MTKDQIMRMARKAGMPDPMVFIGAYERFAASVAADEREACAKVCEQRAGTVSMFATSRDTKIHNQAVTGDAAAIRARGNP